MKYLSVCTLLLTTLSLSANTTMKKALISGITGQDGSYLAEYLLEKGYEVHGIKRRSSSFNTERLDHFYRDKHDKAHNNFFLHYGDVSDFANIMNLVSTIQPDEIYNLAAQSHVHVSFSLPIYTTMVDAIGTLHFLESIRLLGLTKKTRFYQASTSEMFGLIQEKKQCEKTPFYPRSPYAVAKQYGHWITVNYREAYDMFCCSGILFNHESPRRGETFVTRKITRAVAHIKYGLLDTLYLGNIDAKRDWGYAKDYVEAMHMMLQHDTADDFVIATGENHTVREFIELAFKEVGIDIAWQGHGVNEVGLDAKTKKTLIKIDPQYFRPSEVEVLIGDPSKAKKILGWQPRTSFQELVSMMVAHDLESAARKIQKPVLISRTPIQEL